MASLDPLESPNEQDTAEHKIEIGKLTFPSSRTSPGRYLAFASATALILTGLSLPLILTTSHKGSMRSWPYMDIGQMYAVISTMIGAIALTGVAFSLALQHRQNGIHRVEMLRNMQLELTKLGFSHPELNRAWDSPGMPDGELAVHRYINMWFMYYLAGYRIGEFTDSTIVHLVGQDFASPRIIEYWHDVRVRYAAEAHDAVERRFVLLIEREYLARRTTKANRQAASSG